MDDENDDFASQGDAETLMRAHEIRSDKSRHTKAIKHLGKIASKAKGAKNSMSALHKKTGERLNKVFGGGSPFDEAGSKQSTPFDEAAEGQ